jgi:hypothetical protein
MKLRITLLVMLALAAIAATNIMVSGSEDSPAAIPAEMLGKLVERINKLEGRIAKLETHPTFFVEPNPLPGQRPGVASPRPDGHVIAPPRFGSPTEPWVPERSGRFRFNGRDYYMLPIDAQQ